MLQKRESSNSHQSANRLIEWIRRYANSRIDSRLADERGYFPPHVFLDLGNQGFFGMHIPRSQGGLGLKTFDMLRVIEQVAAIDLTLTTLLVESIQGAHTLDKYATNSLKDSYLPQLAAGRILVAGAMTESGAGSNPRAMQAVAVPDGKNQWLIRGSKRWVGMGSWANVIAVYVQQFDLQNNWLGMSGFLVPAESEGLRIGAETQTMGIRAIKKHNIHFDDVKVASEQLLGKLGEGMEIAQDNMMYVRLCLAAASVGAMKRSAQLMYRYAERRTIATGRLLDNPLTLLCLSELTTVIQGVENFVYLIGELLDKNPQIVPEEALVCVKVLASEYLGWAADKLVQVLGARGYEECSGISQLFRDARTFRIFEGPTEALTMYVGSKMLTLNTCIQHFFCNILGQGPIFEEMSTLIGKVKKYCQSEKEHVFSKPFSIDYLCQAMIGDLVSYGFLLAIAEHSAQRNASTENDRVLMWARSQFDNIAQKSLVLSSAEKTVVQSETLAELVAVYSDKIGNIDQARISQEVSLDPLLTCHQEKRVESRNDTAVLVQNKKSINHKSACTLSETDKQQLLQWSKVDTDLTYPNVCVHALFEKHVLQNPEAIALAFGKNTLTYRQLNMKANQLAHYLKKKGVSPDQPVAICLERSFSMIVAVLAVLKAGGAYVPLDRHYPSERLQFMLEDSGATIVLTHKNVSDDLAFKQQELILLDDIADVLALESGKDLQDIPGTDALVYIIYTSGSTGKPKGVMLSHKTLTNLVYWHAKKIGAKRNVLQFTSLSFDMSFFEIFSAFASGGALTLISEENRLDLLSFARIVKQQAIEQLVLPVAFLRKLAEARIDSSYFVTVKEVITAGEQLVVNASIKDFFNKLQHCKLLNYYGPAETHVVSAYELSNKTVDWSTHPPIGKAITHAKILILNDQFQQVPVGVVGEIFLGGVSVARGYHKRSELTQQKFMADPYGRSAQDRLYRTGDLAKYLPDGNIVFIGRQDEQVKIAGFRIELQEIEKVLSQYPSIKNVAVIAKSNGMKESRLEAFFVVDSIVSKACGKKMRSFLREKLPEHMLPLAFHSIDAMPLTPSGKIDKLALKKMASSVSIVSNKIVAPSTETEEKLVDIFEGFFKMRPSVSQSFISLGGNSLLAMTVASMLYKEFSVEVSVSELLSDPTIVGIAKHVDSLRALECEKDSASA